MSLSSGELTQLRNDADNYLLSTCTIQTRTRTGDAMGGDTLGWSNAHTGVNCRLAAMRASPSDDADQFTVHSGWVLSLKHDQAVDVGNRVVFLGETFEVLSVEDTHDYRVQRRAYLKRLD